MSSVRDFKLPPNIVTCNEAVGQLLKVGLMKQANIYEVQPSFFKQISKPVSIDAGDLYDKPEIIFEMIYDEVVFGKKIPDNIMRCFDTDFAIAEIENTELEVREIQEKLCEFHYVSQSTKIIEDELKYSPIKTNYFLSQVRALIQTDEGLLRVMPHIKQLFSSKHVGNCINRLIELGLFAVLFPEIQMIYDFYRREDLPDAICSQESLYHLTLGGDIWNKKVMQPIKSKSLQMPLKKDLYLDVLYIFNNALRFINVSKHVLSQSLMERIIRKERESAIAKKMHKPKPIQRPNPFKF